MPLDCIGFRLRDEFAVGFASHIARMNIVRYMMFLVLGMLLGLVLSGLLSSLVAWFWG